MECRKTSLKKLQLSLVCYFSMMIIWAHFRIAVRYSYEISERTAGIYWLSFFGRMQNSYFQQDGATGHKLKQIWREFYDDPFINSHTNHIYPPQSPDLTPLDYILFPTLKNCIFKQSVDTIEDLKVRITQERDIFAESFYSNIWKYDTPNQCIYRSWRPTLPAFIVNSLKYITYHK